MTYERGRRRGGFQSHITRNFSIKSRITDNFLTNHVKGVSIGCIIENCIESNIFYPGINSVLFAMLLFVRQKKDDLVVGT